MKSLSLASLLPVLDVPVSPLTEISRPDLHVVSRQEFLAPPAEQMFMTAQLPTDADPSEPEPDLWSQGYDAGLAAARAEIAQIAGAREGLMQESVASARLQWRAQEADRIAGGVEKALAAIQSELCAGAERIFLQIIQKSLQARALSEFSTAVERLLRGGDAGVVTIHAPADLAVDLEARLRHLGIIEFNVSETAEVWVRVGQTMIETRLSRFLQNIEQEI